MTEDMNEFFFPSLTCFPLSFNLTFQTLWLALSNIFKNYWTCFCLISLYFSKQRFNHIFITFNPVPLHELLLPYLSLSAVITDCSALQ